MNAILSDIHGNLEALQAVLADITRRGVEEVYCLGDLTGYGPNPRECLDLATQWDVTLLGDFDFWLLQNPSDLGPMMPRHLDWTRSQLATPEGSSRRAFLEGLPRMYLEGDCLLVHGSPRNPLYEFIFPEDTYCEPKMKAVFSLVERCCFGGHTHVPGIFTENLEYHCPDEIGDRYRLDRRKTLVNVGSVGQPRDGDWRACYVVFDGETVEFRRVEYDVDATVKKIHQIRELDNFQGDRLREGL